VSLYSTLFQEAFGNNIKQYEVIFIELGAKDILPAVLGAGPTVLRSRFCPTKHYT
jgi:hypothetical protein